MKAAIFYQMHLLFQAKWSDGDFIYLPPRNNQNTDKTWYNVFKSLDIKQWRQWTLCDSKWTIMRAPIAQPVFLDSVSRLLFREGGTQAELSGVPELRRQNWEYREIQEAGGAHRTECQQGERCTERMIGRQTEGAEGHHWGFWWVLMITWKPSNFGERTTPKDRK